MDSAPPAQAASGVRTATYFVKNPDWAIRLIDRFAQCSTDHRDPEPNCPKLTRYRKISHDGTAIGTLLGKAHRRIPR